MPLNIPPEAAPVEAPAAPIPPTPIGPPQTEGSTADALTALLEFLQTLKAEGDIGGAAQSPFEEPMTPERGALQTKQMEQNDPLQGLKYALRAKEIPAMASQVAKLGMG